MGRPPAIETRPAEVREPGPEQGLALSLKPGDGDRTRTKSLEDPCVPSRPFAWSLGATLQSGQPAAATRRDAMRAPGHPLLTATVTTSAAREPREQGFPWDHVAADNALPNLQMSR
jgi:hypothetical protein